MTLYPAFVFSWSTFWRVLLLSSMKPLVSTLRKKQFIPLAKKKYQFFTPSVLECAMICFIWNILQEKTCLRSQLVGNGYHFKYLKHVYLLQVFFHFAVDEKYRTTGLLSDRKWPALLRLYCTMWKSAFSQVNLSFNMQGSVLSGQLQLWGYAVEISEWLTDFIAQFLPKNLFF